MICAAKMTFLLISFRNGMGSFNGAVRHSERERYGQISDQELIKAINLMTFDHGETEIWLSSPK